MSYGEFNQKIVGSHTEDEWQALVRKYGWRCFYCGSPVCAWRAADQKIMQIRNRNAARPWESSGKVLAHVEIESKERVPPERILTKDHLVPVFPTGVRSEDISNIRPACLRCNRMKKNKSVSEFIKDRPALILSWINSLPENDWRVQEFRERWQAEEIICDSKQNRNADIQGLCIAERSDQHESLSLSLSLASDFAVPPLPSGKMPEDFLKDIVREREYGAWWKR